MSEDGGSGGHLTLEDSIESVASMASLSSSFDKSGTLGNTSGGSPHQLQPVSMANSGTTTHSKTHGLRRDKRNDDHTKVVEVVTSSNIVLTPGARLIASAML